MYSFLEVTSYLVVFACRRVFTLVNIKYQIQLDLLSRKLQFRLKAIQIKIVSDKCVTQCALYFFKRIKKVSWIFWKESISYVYLVLLLRLFFEKDSGTSDECLKCVSGLNKAIKCIHKLLKRSILFVSLQHEIHFIILSLLLTFLQISWMT